MGLKAQSEIMEYIFMVVFLMALIIGLMLFLSWWNVSQSRVEALQSKEERIASITRYLMSEPMFANEDSMFDDAKLTAINDTDTVKCQEFEGILGSGWYVKIRSLDMEGEHPCKWSNYPDCNLWVICKEKQNHIAQRFPVNIYRKISDNVSIGILEVGVYS